MKKLIVTIAGDSGDGIQLLGNAFTDNVAIQNYQLKTLPDFPAEIRAPAGTTHGVSGFQIQYGQDEVNTAGHFSDIFIAFNVAGLKKYIDSIHPQGLILYDPAGFDSKNYKLAQYTKEDFDSLQIRKEAIEFSKLTKEALVGYDLSEKEKDHNKNIFVLGFLDFAIHSNLDKSKELILEKFKKSNLKNSMIEVLSKGFHYAETIEFSFENATNHSTQIELAKHNKSGEYRNITGNKAISLALLSVPYIFDRPLFFSGYPITPASDILHELSKYQFENIQIKQAEDELAAISMAIGGSYGGSIGVTASSGPGIDLKQEAIGLAQMAELPVLIIDVQRAGPSTGMPTKLEQSDLNLVLYGRHGDSSIPVLAIKSPSTAFDTTIKAIEIMIQFQTPVFLLSDALIANGSELWKIPELQKKKKTEEKSKNPFERNDNMVRPWIEIGSEGINYIAGGLEKNYQTGEISYEGDNHEKMTETRTNKIKYIANILPEIQLEKGSPLKGSIIVSWGSTYGSIREVISEVSTCAHLHLEWINPLPKNTAELLSNYNKIIVVELNQGQLANYLSQFTSITIIKINKVKGSPFYKEELIEKIKSCI